MRTLLLGLALSTLATAACSSSSGPSDATLTIANQETFSITDIYIGPSDGTFPTSDNLLSAGTLDPGVQITVSVQCEAYDVEIIDATGTDCYVLNYSLCGTDDIWILDNTFFNTCSSTPRKAPAAPAAAATNEFHMPVVLGRSDR